MIRIGIVAALFIIIVAAIFFGFRKAADNREAEIAAEVAKARAAAGSSTSAAPPPAAPGSAAPGSGAPAKPSTIKRIDPAARQQLLEQLARARARRGVAGGTAPAPAAGAPPELSKDYIRTQVRELIPLLSECYERALEEDPKLGGKLVVKFAIGGEPEVGGLVETSEVDATQSTIAHAGMVECVRETMYGAEFVPPAEGGRVEVTYPFEFSSN